MREIGWNSIVLIISVLSVQVYGIEKRGILNIFAGAISNIGTAVLPEASMRAGCNSVGLYNREKDGGPPRSDVVSKGAVDKFADTTAALGNTILPRSSMKKGCINAGFYDPNLDSEGKPKKPVSTGSEGSGTQLGGTQVLQVVNTNNCRISGFEVPCNPKLIAAGLQIPL